MDPPGAAIGFVRTLSQTEVQPKKKINIEKKKDRIITRELLS